VASAATTQGICNWKPQPSCAPPARSAISSPASSTKLSTTPTVKAAPCARRLAEWRRCAASSCRWCCSSDSSLSDSTGNTQGMRLRIRPPIRAPIRAPQKPTRAAPPASTIASGAPPPTAGTRPATSGTSSVPAQPPWAAWAGPPLTTSTPLRVLKAALTGCTARRYRALPSPSACSTCGAAASMRCSSSGKNSTLAGSPPCAPTAPKLSLMRLASIEAATCARSARPGISLRVASNWAARWVGAAVASTSSASFKSAPPGMHTSLQISQSARAASSTTEPGFRPAGGESSVSSRTSPS